MKKAIVTAVMVCAAVAHGAVLGTVNLADYNSYKHDIKGNTVAVKYTRSNQQIDSCFVALFDKAGTKKLEVAFPDALGAASCTVRACDNTWALLQVGETYYSVVIAKDSITVLGTASETVFRYRFMSGKLLVSYLNTPKSCQVFDRNLSVAGAASTILGTPQPLNLGKYFYCEGDGRTQIWRVKKDLIKLIDETGEYEEIYEPGRLCCIQDEDLHKICKY